VPNIVLLLVLAVVLALNAAATGAILRDDYSGRRQKIVQTILVWFVPLLGALVVLGVHRAAEKPSRSYRRDHDGVGDHFGTQHPATRALNELLDGD